MAARFRPRNAGGDYFATPEINFIPTGCTLLDCVLGGGWPLGRVANIVGDKSTGKTLLAIEAAANFAATYPKGKIWYRESEAAFDVTYAKQLGLPIGSMDFGKQGYGTAWNTIEDIIEDLDDQITQIERAKTPGGLYIIDSLDALSSRAALKRKPGEGSYNLEKPKLLSQELFQKWVRRVRDANICLLVISQVRDRIGVVFGDKHERSGGRAMDFYASIVVWLSHIGTLTRQIGGFKRPTAVQVRAKCKKNKIGPPGRECEFLIRFGFGVDDVEANLDWLADAGRLQAVDKTLRKEQLAKFLADTEKLSTTAYRQRQAHIQAVVKQAWSEVEGTFLPRHRKYAAIETEA